ncbi:MAG TPA: hypothetical protein VIL25_03825 [Vicinamibacterales bacterium]
MDGVVRARLVDAESGGVILPRAAFREPVRVGDSVVVRAQGQRLGAGWKDGDVGTVTRIARAVAPADDDVHLRRVAPPTPPAAAAPSSGRAAAAAWPLPQAGVVDYWARLRSSVHEAGHVVAAHALGATPTAASVAPIGAVTAELGSVEVPDSTALPWHAQSLLAISGRAAEDVAGLPPRPWREGDPDLARFRTTRWFAAGQPPVPLSDMDRLLAGDLRTVRVMLREREAVLERVAHALRARGRLGAAELAELLGTEPARAPVEAVPAQDADVAAVPGGKALFTGTCIACGATYSGPSRTRCMPCATGRH